MKQPAIYIMTNQKYGTLYVGVTSHLARRVYQHKAALLEESFTAKYACKNLVYYEMHADMISAIAREKQLKAGRRMQKMKLIESMNPEWRDLYKDIL